MTYDVTGTDFSSGTTKHKTILRAKIAAIKRVNATIYRRTIAGRVPIARVVRETGYTALRDDRDDAGREFNRSFYAVRPLRSAIGDLTDDEFRSLVATA